MQSYACRAGELPFNGNVHEADKDGSVKPDYQNY